MIRNSICIRASLFILLAVASASLGACVPGIVANYDRATFEETLKVGKEVDLFYGMLLETPEDERNYSAFLEQYVTIEADIRSLLSRNQARPLNEESTMIIGKVLEFWTKYKEKHKSQDNYSTGTAKIHRNRFFRLFNAAIEAEAAKQLDSDNSDPTNTE